MCDSVFIAADRPLPIIHWNEEEPSFYTKEIREEDNWVKAHLSKPFIYFAGSHLGCGCGFSYNLERVKTDKSQQDEYDSRESTRRLSEYLNKATQDGPVEVITSDGANSDEVTERKTVTPSYFSGEAFNIEDLNIFIVEAERDNLQE